MCGYLCAGAHFKYFWGPVGGRLCRGGKTISLCSLFFVMLVYGAHDTSVLEEALCYKISKCTVKMAIGKKMPRTLGGEKWLNETPSHPGSFYTTILFHLSFLIERNQRNDLIKSNSQPAKSASCTAGRWHHLLCCDDGGIQAPCVFSEFDWNDVIVNISTGIAAWYSLNQTNMCYKLAGVSLTVGTTGPLQLIGAAGPWQINVEEGSFKKITLKFLSQVTYHMMV